MDWNAKSPGQWDWQHFFFLNSKETENPRSQPTDWSGEEDQEINVGLSYPSGGSGHSGSDLIHATSSRSSKSPSNNSSSNDDSKTSMLTLEGSPDDSDGKKELTKVEPVETSTEAEPSSASGEPLLTLKLGKRLYFEDVCAGIDSKKPSLSSGKRCKSSSQNIQHQSCQVEGCGLDLSSAKEYHRKHRVCESHSKSPKVVIAGLERRFCQQCSRFHAMLEFDDKKRSCRRRLSDHNARRRKPQPEAVQLNSSASSTYGINHKDGRQIMNPFAFSRTTTNLPWQDMHSSKIHQTKDFLLKPGKAFNKTSSIVPVLSGNSSGLLTSRGIGTKSIVTGIEDSTTSSTQEVNRALSLLSINSWGATYETKSLSLEYSNQSITHANAMTLPSSEYWPSDISYSDCDNSNRFQDFQLLDAPFESGFPCNQVD